MRGARRGVTVLFRDIGQDAACFYALRGDGGGHTRRGAGEAERREEPEAALESGARCGPAVSTEILPAGRESGGDGHAGFSCGPVSRGFAFR